MHIAERKDRLAAEFPLFTDGSHPLKTSQQADALMRDLDANAEALERDGWHFGHSRLAISGGRRRRRRGMRLLRVVSLRVSVRPDLQLELDAPAAAAIRTFRVSAGRGRVARRRVRRPRADSRGDRTSGEAVSFDADRVYLAAGVFNTTAILLASLDAYDVPVPVLDSQLFLVPTLRFRACPRSPRSRSTRCPRYSSN
jgi:hypothetical protein